MSTHVFVPLSIGLTAALMASGALAQATTHPGNVLIVGDLEVNNGAAGGKLYVETDSVIDGSLCLGNTCSASETFLNDETLRFQYTQLSIQFNDTSGSTSPNRDWTLRINDPNTVATGGIDRFSVEDNSAGTTPFTIAGGVPNNAFWLASTGNLGLGTSLPQTGMHLLRSNGTGAMLIEETSAGTLGQLTLRNNGITFFTLEDTSIAAGDNTGRLWNFQNQAGTFRVTTAPGGANDIEMILTPAGDLTIEGDLFTTGGVCSSGCDRVFDADYPLPSIAEQHEMMMAARHLPAVGPTPEEGPFNVSQKVGGMLNELEKAHLFIAQLDARLVAQDAALQAQDAQIAAQARLIAHLSERFDRIAP